MCRLTRRATVIAGAIAALTVSATTAAAESGYVAGYCNQLQAQYRAARASTGQSGGRVGAQIAQATRSLAQARADARRYGCLGGFPFFNNRPQCASITSQIDRLSQALYRLRGGSNWFGDPNAEVARLASLMRDSGCDTPQPGNGLSLAGGDRALCVRVCDGYFFPIEFNVRRSRLKVDAAVCQSMYAKDGQAALFVTRDAGCRQRHLAQWRALRRSALRLPLHGRIRCPMRRPASHRHCGARHPLSVAGPFSSSERRVERCPHHTAAPAPTPTGRLGRSRDARQCRRRLSSHGTGRAEGKDRPHRRARLLRADV